MLIAIRHVTRYAYEEAADYSIQSLRLTPPSFEGQRVVNWELSVPGGELIDTGLDGYGNIAHLVTFVGRHDEIVIEAVGEVDTEDRHGVVRGLTDPVPPRVFLRRTPQTMPDDEIRALADSVSGEAEPIPRLHLLSERIGKLMEFEAGVTHAHTSAAEALADRKGVCQDFSHVFIACARHLAIPARYVTGYLLLENDEGVNQAHHAWAEAYVQDLGWVGFDVANEVCPTERYVRLACGLDARAAAPVRGTRRGGENEALDVHVVVAENQTQSQTQQ